MGCSSRAILSSQDRGEDRDVLDAAIGFAAYYHRSQTRASRQGLSWTHYIEHPLRVCLRLRRWGITALPVLVAAVLHDVLEDCHEEIEEDFHRPAAEVLQSAFGDEVALIVKALTNPPTVPGATRAERNARYLDHVAVAVRDDRVLMVKFSDFADNALSLHHHQHLDGMASRLATKYAPLVPIFDRALSDLIFNSAEQQYMGAAVKMKAALTKNQLAELASHR